MRQILRLPMLNTKLFAFEPQACVYDIQHTNTLPILPAHKNLTLFRPIGIIRVPVKKRY